jgi:hypothetical protein
MGALRISAGVIVWALHFALVYGFTGLACARGLGAAVPWVVAAVTALAAALAVLLVLKNLHAEFIQWMTAAVAAAALVAILWEGLAGLLVPTCG